MSQLGQILHYLMLNKYSLRHGKIASTQSLPEEVKKEAKKFNIPKFLSIFGKEKGTVLKLQKKFSKYTGNIYFSLLLSSLATVRSKIVKTTPEQEASLIEKELLKRKITIYTIAIVAVSLLWFIVIYASDKTVKLSISKKDDIVLSRVYPEATKKKMIPIVVLLVALFVAGIYFFTEHGEEPTDNEEEQFETRSKEDENISPFVL